MFVRVGASYLRDSPDDDARRFKYARSLAILGRNAEAKREYRTLLDRDFRKTDCLYNLACIAIDEDQNESAVRLLQDALSLAPNDRECSDLLDQLANRTE